MLVRMMAWPDLAGGSFCTAARSGFGSGNAPQSKGSGYHGIELDSEALLRQGRFREALDRARSRGDLRGAVLAALSLGENALAEGLLSAWKSAGLEAEAERLALLGFLEGRKGRLERYRELALEGAKRAQTPLTLYHLGLALPPKQGLVALEEAFKGVQGNPEAEGRIALALARVLRRLGRFREALACAALAELRRPEPFRTLERLWLSLLAEETPSLAELAREAEPLLLHEGRGVWLYATWLLAQLRFLEGDLRGAARLLESLLSLTPWQGLPFFAPMGVRLLREAGQVEAAHRLLQAARVAEGLSPLHRGLVRLAEGLLQFPEGGREALQEAFSLLSEEVAEEALLACFHLQRLGLAPQSPTPWPQTLSARGLRLLGGERLSCAVPIPYLEVLGGGRLAGLYPPPPPAGPRAPGPPPLPARGVGGGRAGPGPLRQRQPSRPEDGASPPAGGGAHPGLPPLPAPHPPPGGLSGSAGADPRGKPSGSPPTLQRPPSSAKRGSGGGGTPPESGGANQRSRARYWRHGSYLPTGRAAAGGPGGMGGSPGPPFPPQPSLPRHCCPPAAAAAGVRGLAGAMSPRREAVRGVTEGYDRGLDGQP